MHNATQKLFEYLMEKKAAAALQSIEPSWTIVTHIDFSESFLFFFIPKKELLVDSGQ